MEEGAGVDVSTERPVPYCVLWEGRNRDVGRDLFLEVAPTPREALVRLREPLRVYVKEALTWREEHLVEDLDDLLEEFFPEAAAADDWPLMTEILEKIERLLLEHAEHLAGSVGGTLASGRWYSSLLMTFQETWELADGLYILAEGWLPQLTHDVVAELWWGRRWRQPIDIRVGGLLTRLSQFPQPTSPEWRKGQVQSGAIELMNQVCELL